MARRSRVWRAVGLGCRGAQGSSRVSAQRSVAGCIIGKLKMRESFRVWMCSHYSRGGSISHLLCQRDIAVICECWRAQLAHRLTVGIISIAFPSSIADSQQLVVTAVFVDGHGTDCRANLGDRHGRIG